MSTALFPNFNMSTTTTGSTPPRDDAAGADFFAGMFGGGVDCFSPLMIMTNGLWLGDQPLRYALPLFLIQVLVISLVTRLVRAAIKPFGQPLVLAEMLAGLLIGRSGLGAFSPIGMIFPSRSINILGSAGDLGLMYYSFMVGLEMDEGAVKKLSAKAVLLGACTIVVPAVVTVLAAYPFRHVFHEDALDGNFFLYLGVALSVTSFPAVARVLGELRLLGSEIGQLSLLVSTANDVLSQVLIGVFTAFGGVTDTDGGEMQVASGTNSAAPVIFFFGSMFVVVCVFLVRPALEWVLNRSPEGEQMSDIGLGLILMGVAIAGFVADIIGINYVFGAFVFGLCVPHGQHSTVLVNRLEGSVTSFLLPLFFASSGLKADITGMSGFKPAVLLVGTYILSSILKVVSTVLVSLYYYSMPIHEALSLGFLMNTKGLVDTIFVDVASQRKVLTMDTVVVLTIMSTAMNALVIPAVTAAYKPSRRLGGYARRNLMRMKPEEEMNMVACIHTGRNVPSVIGLLDFTNPTKRSPINIYPLHLIELTGRASAMIIVHDTDPKTKGSSRGGRSHVQSEHIISAFETYEQQTGSGISLQPLTAICPYSSMHEDVCSLAEDNQAAIIILPFHKIQMVDGSMEANPAIRTINQNILNQAPCSVGILVDRSLNTGKASLHATHNIAILFFGGPDDREALAYAWRMAGHPSIFLTLVRFIPGGETSTRDTSLQSNGHLRLAQTEGDRDQALDDECVSEFRLKHLNCENIVYREKVVSNVEETVEAVQSLTSNHDFYLVGRSQRKDLNQLTAGLTEWSECPELGPIGDLLASMDLGTMVSVLVVQQYVPAAPQSDSPDNSVKQYVNRADHRART